MALIEGVRGACCRLCHPATARPAGRLSVEVRTYRDRGMAGHDPRLTLTRRPNAALCANFNGTGWAAWNPTYSQRYMHCGPLAQGARLPR